MTLYLHATTGDEVARLKQRLPHAVLLAGERGSGLLTLARNIAAAQLVNLIQPTTSDGDIASDGAGEIRISQIRALTEQMRGKSTMRRVVVIDNADQMTLQAQNAFLKLLEEPPAHTHFILTAHRSDQLLPTISSRLQHTLVRPISRAQSARLIDEYGTVSPQKRAQLLFLAEGHPAELMRLLEDTDYFTTQAGIVADARTYLSGTIGERTHIAHTYGSDRRTAHTLIGHAIHLLHTTLTRQPSPRITASLDQLMTIYDQIEVRANTKLALLSFVV